MAREPAAETLIQQFPPAPPREPSVLARGILLAYLALIIYASLYPFSGWEQLGVPLEKYLYEPIPPRYWTGFDVVTNILGYVPLGVLAVYAFYPSVRGVAAMLLAALLGILVSGSMEALQSFLPTRVTSNLDFLTNSTGALIGAVLGALTYHQVLERSRLRRLRHRLFTPEASRGVVLMALWPLAQIYPQSYLFGTGQLLPVLSDWLSLWTDVPIDLSDLLRNGMQLSASQYWQVEIVVTCCSTAGALLVWFHMLRDKAPRFLLVIAMLAAALAVKTLSMALLFKPQNALAWLSEGAQLGLLAGVVLLALLVWLPKRLQRYMAIMLLAIAFVTINVAPANPYFVATLETWVQGKFLNFNGAAQFLSLVWPLIAFWFLLHRTHRLKRS
ncbi:VanZ family protein [uncultured Oxalicibacterium sp.]|uniref:VanZ family protein n=1 Tax=uncultured Oxalicibacterium sp. TaxID=1168540 RepID=UPI0025E5BC37|nr:VanZ family protein [uncultured Oxalicibacterium sp.]